MHLVYMLEFNVGGEMVRIKELRRNSRAVLVSDEVNDRTR